MKRHVDIRSLYGAELAVASYRNHTGCSDDDCLGDLLRDLQFWAWLTGFDFESAYARASQEFVQELGPC